VGKAGLAETERRLANRLAAAAGLEEPALPLLVWP
jgi:hypothetical protein